MNIQKEENRMQVDGRRRKIALQIRLTEEEYTKLIAVSEHKNLSKSEIIRDLIKSLPNIEKKIVIDYQI